MLVGVAWIFISISLILELGLPTNPHKSDTIITREKERETSQWECSVVSEILTTNCPHRYKAYDSHSQAEPTQAVLTAIWKMGSRCHVRRLFKRQHWGSREAAGLEIGVKSHWHKGE